MSHFFSTKKQNASFHYGGYRNLKISLGGVWQIENAVLAAETVRVLNGQGVSIGEDALRQGLVSAQWRGRLTILQKKPYVIADGAHNADAAEKLAQSLSFYFTNKSKVFIMGVLGDKDYEAIVNRMAPLAEQIIAVTPPERSPAYTYQGINVHLPIPAGASTFTCLYLSGYQRSSASTSQCTGTLASRSMPANLVNDTFSCLQLPASHVPPTPARFPRFRITCSNFPR